MEFELAFSQIGSIFNRIKEIRRFVRIHTSNCLFRQFWTIHLIKYIFLQHIMLIQVIKEDTQGTELAFERRLTVCVDTAVFFVFLEVIQIVLDEKCIYGRQDVKRDILWRITRMFGIDLTYIFEKYFDVTYIAQSGSRRRCLLDTTDEPLDVVWKIVAHIPDQIQIVLFFLLMISNISHTIKTSQCL